MGGKEAPWAVGMGIPVSDYILRVDRLPEPNGSCRALSHSWQQGGKASTAMAALGRLGVPCAFVGVVGADLDGEAHRADLRFNGVDDSHVVVDPAFETAYNVVLADERTGSRSFIQGLRRVRGLRPDEIDGALFRGARCLLVEQGGEAERVAAAFAREGGATLVCDADRHSDRLERLLPALDVVIASEEFASVRNPGLSPLAFCRDVQRLGPRTVVLTLGPKGCVGVAGDASFEVPTFPVAVVDTTGAGDVFHGAYLHGLRQGWTAKDCCVWASATASIKCMAIGGRAGLPTAPDVERFLATGTVNGAFLEERVRRYASPYRGA